MEDIFLVVNDINLKINKNNEIILEDLKSDFDLIKESSKLRELIARSANTAIKSKGNFFETQNEFVLKYKGEKIVFDIEGNMKITKKADINKLINDINNIIKKEDKTEADWDAMKNKIDEIKNEQKKIEDTKKELEKLQGKMAIQKDITPKSPITEEIKPPKMSIYQAIRVLESFLKEKKDVPENIVKAVEKIKSLLNKNQDKEDEEMEKFSDKKSLLIKMVKKISFNLIKLNKIAKEESFKDITEEKEIEDLVDKTEKLVEKSLKITEDDNLKEEFNKIKDIIKNIKDKSLKTKEDKKEEKVNVVKNNPVKNLKMDAKKEPETENAMIRQEEVAPATKTSSKNDEFDFKKIIKELKKYEDKLDELKNNFPKAANLFKKSEDFSQERILKDFIDIANEIVEKYKDRIHIWERAKTNPDLKEMAIKNLKLLFDKINFMYQTAKEDKVFEEKIQKEDELKSKVKNIESFLERIKTSRFEINDKVWLKESELFSDECFGYVVAKSKDKVVVAWNNSEVLTEEDPNNLIKDFETHAKISFPSLMTKESGIILKSKYLYGDAVEVKEQLKNASLIEELNKIKEQEKSGEDVVIHNRKAKIISEKNGKINILIDGKEINLFKYQI